MVDSKNAISQEVWYKIILSSLIIYKCIYNMRLAGFLMMHGIPLKRMETNLDRRKWNVYLFENSNVIEELIEEFKLQKTKGEIIYVNIKDGRCKS